MKQQITKIKKLNYEKYKPGIHKKYLLIISGLMWTGVGIFLSSLATGWLISFDNVLIYYISGFILAFAIHIFGFSLLAKKNSQRIVGMNKRKVCIFAFQRWSSYAIIVIMMSLGMFMRSSPIPKNLLSIVYFGIGGALFLSSMIYYKSFYNNFIKA